jgi:hypothetical protein
MQTIVLLSASGPRSSLDRAVRTADLLSNAPVPACSRSESCWMGHSASGAESNRKILIDRYLPRFDVTLVEHTIANADVPTTWAALRGLDFAQVNTPLTDAAIFVRALPGRVAGRLGRGATPSSAPSRLPLGGDGPGLPGWLSLGEVPEQEIALGAVGRFWQPDIRGRSKLRGTRPHFAASTDAAK